MRKTITPVCIAVAGLLMAATFTSAEIRPGSTKSAVLAELGPPIGAMCNGNHEMLMYMNGTVELQKGVVILAEIHIPKGRRVNSDGDWEKGKRRKGKKGESIMQVVSGWFRSLVGSADRARKVLCKPRIDRK